jgi:hypothetical protein
VKNPFGISPIYVFQLGVIYMSYRQVLTLIHNSQLLLKLPILDKFRFATFHKGAKHKETTVLKLVKTSSGEMQVLMTLN